MSHTKNILFCTKFAAIFSDLLALHKKDDPLAGWAEAGSADAQSASGTLHTIICFLTCQHRKEKDDPLDGWTEAGSKNAQSASGTPHKNMCFLTCQHRIEKDDPLDGWAEAGSQDAQS